MYIYMFIYIYIYIYKYIYIGCIYTCKPIHIYILTPYAPVPPAHGAIIYTHVLHTTHDIPKTINQPTLNDRHPALQQETVASMGSTSMGIVDAISGGGGGRTWSFRRAPQYYMDQQTRRALLLLAQRPSLTPANLQQQWPSFAARATVASVGSTIGGIADAISSEGTDRAWSCIESQESTRAPHQDMMHLLLLPDGHPSQQPNQPTQPSLAARAAVASVGSTLGAISGEGTRGTWSSIESQESTIVLQFQECQC